MRFARWSGGSGAGIIVRMQVPAAVCKVLGALAAVCVLGLIPGALLTDSFPEALAVLGFLVPLYGTALFAYYKRPDLPIARLLLVAASCWTVNLSLAGVLDGIHDQEGLVSELWPVALIGGLVEMGALVFSALFMALFPAGRYERPYERVAARVMLALLAVPALDAFTSPTADVAPEASGAHETSNPLQIGGLSGLDDLVDGIAHLSGIAFAAAVVLLFLRYRRWGQEQRSQIRLVLFVAFAGVVGAEFLWLLTPFDTAGIVWAVGCASLLPVAVLVAILRYRLLEADVLIRKSLVYGALWIVIAAAYVGAAAALGIAAGGRVPLTVAVLLTIVATLAFQPARRRLEALADRWVFGERLGGYELLTRFGATLEETFDPDELFARLADTVKRGLRVRWARVLVRRPAGEGSVLDPQAAAGIEPDAAVEPVERVPLTHGGEPLGVIEVGPKEEGELSDADRDLLATLTRQAALAIHNARLASELSVSLAEIKVQAEELRASRKRLVSAGDAERRRIERNIHDGVQQELVALIANLRLARNQLGREPTLADSTLAGLQDEAGHLLEDLRELARGIHPSLLSDHGLVEAIEARAARMPVPVSVQVDAASRRARFGDDIEGAAYFVVSEALANVLKHSGAERATIGIGYAEGSLELDVSDDGTGFDPGEAGGSGLANMSDRLEALGGRLVLRSRPGEGTRLSARLPAHPRERVHV
jgi:signal transduction histidine kinase